MNHLTFLFQVLFLLPRKLTQLSIVFLVSDLFNI